jgi:hypothetical protein
MKNAECRMNGNGNGNGNGENGPPSLRLRRASGNGKRLNPQMTQMSAERKNGKTARTRHTKGGQAESSLVALRAN